MTITSLGLPAPPLPWEGTVHSVFSNSCNIRPAHGGPLITLHSFDFGSLPHSLFVPQLDTGGWRPGDPVRADSSGVQVGKHLLEWGANLAETDTRIPRRPLPSSWAEAEALLAGNRRHTTGHPLLREVYAALAQALDGLWEALLAGRAESVAAQCQACIGLGQGLTPSGDDMLLGTFAALHMYEPDLVPVLAQGVLPQLDRTNDISASYLTLAAQGRAATPVIQALTELGTGATQGARLLLGVGHASGGDILQGILTALNHLFEQEKGRQ